MMSRFISLRRALKDAIKGRLDARYVTQPSMKSLTRRMDSSAAAQKATELRLQDIETDHEAVAQIVRDAEATVSSFDQVLTSLHRTIELLRIEVDALRSDMVGQEGGKLSAELSQLGAVSDEAKSLALECAKAIDHLLAAEVEILQRLDGFEDG